MVNKLDYFILNKNNFFFKIKVFNVYILDLIFSYKGLRHLNGLPVRGQRTWTNSNNSKICNLILKNYKVNLIKKIYNTLNMNFINSFLLLEYFNLIWKLNWTTEWLVLKKKKMFFQKKKNKNIKPKVDLLSINLELISLRSSVLKKKSKFNSKNNFSILGFEPFSSVNILK